MSSLRRIGLDAGTISWISVDALSQLHALAAQLDLNGLLRMVTHGTGSISVDPHLGFQFELAALETKVASRSGEHARMLALHCEHARMHAPCERCILLRPWRGA